MPTSSCAAKQALPTLTFDSCKLTLNPTSNHPPAPQSNDALRGEIEALRGAPSPLAAARAAREETQADRDKFLKLLDNLQVRGLGGGCCAAAGTCRRRLGLLRGGVLMRRSPSLQLPPSTTLCPLAPSAGAQGQPAAQAGGAAGRRGGAAGGAGGGEAPGSSGCLPGRLLLLLLHCPESPLCRTRPPLPHCLRTPHRPPPTPPRQVERENEGLRARIAAQTVHPADVMRMNQEK